jgi:hypothetical protein
LVTTAEVLRTETPLSLARIAEVVLGATVEGTYMLLASQQLDR